MKNRIAAGAVTLAVAGILAAGCSSGSGTHISNQGGSMGSRVSTAATSTAAARARADLKVISAKCGTVTAAGQLAAVRELGSKAGRETLWARCGVPKAKRSAVETQALAAAEQARLFKGGHDARVKYFTVTLPGIIEANQA